MADISNSNWSEADSSNSNPAPDGVPSGILPSQIGGVIRSMRGATKRSWNRSNAILVSTGTAAALLLTYEQAPPAYIKGEVYRFFVHTSNTGATTININSLGTRALNRADGTALSAGELVSGQVATIVYDGANFLHQSVGSRFFKDNVSITLPTDAILTLEDTSAPATAFRRKGIYSSKNVGGGNDWLFRQTRPSDGAFEDFTLKSGQSGTIFTTGNFNPALKADLTGASFSGDITSYRAAAPTQGVLYLGNSGSRYLHYDGGGYHLPGAVTNLAGLNSSANVNVTGHLYAKGGRIHVHDNTAAGYVFFGNADQSYLGHDGGNFQAVGAGTLFVNGVEVTRQNQYHVSPGYGFTGHSGSYVYADAGTDNVVIRHGNATVGWRYSNFRQDGWFVPARGADFPENINVGVGQTQSSITMFDSDNGNRSIHNNSGYIGFLGSDGGWKARVGDDGAFWTSQLGDINTRIETRAAAYADGRVAKTGDTMTGSLQIQVAYPTCTFHYPGIRIWDLQVREDGRLYFHANGSFNVMSIGVGGDITTQQMGDLNNRIETRAQAWANTRQGALGFTPVRQSGGAYQQGNTVYLGWDGAALRAQVDSSDLERIVTRSWCNPIIDIRLAYAGDLANDWNQYGGMAEPYGGGVMTTRSINTINGVTYWNAARWRYLQRQDSYGNWYTVGYA